MMEHSYENKSVCVFLCVFVWKGEEGGGEGGGGQNIH